MAFTSVSREGKYLYLVQINVKWGIKSTKKPLGKLIHVYVAGNSNQITKIDVLKLVNTRRSKQFVVISSTSQKLG